MAIRVDKARFQRIFLLLGLGTFAVYAGFLALVLLYFRGEQRLQIIEGHGHLLMRFSQHLFDQRDHNLPVDFELLALATETAEIEGVIALRLYHPLHQLIERIPDTVISARISDDDLATISSTTPIIRYFPIVPEIALFGDSVLGGIASWPLVEVLVPLHDQTGTVIAAVQYWMDGHDAALALARLDRSLMSIGGAFLLGGTALYLLLFISARKRLIALGRILAERNTALESANRELGLLAKTAALGSVTAHLFHGLKNPLAGLKSYLRLTGEDAEAVALADRMQSLVNETLAVIQQQTSGRDQRLTILEFSKVARTRLTPTTEAARLQLDLNTTGEGSITDQQAQLLLLILRNLIDNAVEASRPGQSVSIDIQGDDGQLSMRVRDSGKGIPEPIQAQLFSPMPSSKPSGTGLGLSICALIARQIPATLKLERSRPGNTVFLLQISSPQTIKAVP